MTNLVCRENGDLARSYLKGEEVNFMIGRAQVSAVNAIGTFAGNGET